MGCPQQRFWMEAVQHDGMAPLHPYEGYVVFRSVRDYGAVGDGVADDTAAINSAIASLAPPGTLPPPEEGERCGFMGESTSVAPAVVYFPSGIYRVSAPLLSFYYTQLVGSAKERPTILADASFQGFAVIDEDPYGPDGKNWYTNQNNFFREVRNLVIRLTDVPPEREAVGIHHQVSQATGLYNVDIRMRPGSCHRGIFMENGSGGMLRQLRITGGHTGAVFGNQQFTAQDLTFQDCSVAIDHIWAWGWVFHHIVIVRCNTGFLVRGKHSMAGDDEKQQQAVGGVTFLDCKVIETHTAVLTEGIQESVNMVIDHLTLRDCAAAVRDAHRVLLPGPGVDTHTSFVIPSWSSTTTGRPADEFLWGKASRPPALVDQHGLYFRRPRPQYENEHESSFRSAKEWGARGDGHTDDTAALQQALVECARNAEILFVPHGVYMVSSTLLLPVGTRLVGEVWSVLMGYGTVFNDTTQPHVVFRVGNPGDEGLLEVSDIIFSIRGPAPGAIVVEWNARQPEGQPGAVGMWDSHIRIGGFAGSNLEAGQTPSRVPYVEDAGRAGFIALHITKRASFYASNVWVWVGDHDLDGKHEQINVFCARGVLIEADPGPVWLYGTGSEHNVLYQYNLNRARNLLMLVGQTETPYMLGQGFPLAGDISKPDPYWGDLVPMFPDDPRMEQHRRGESQDPHVHRSWGALIQLCRACRIYGLNIYSFFDAYDQAGLKTKKGCQRALLRTELDEDVSEPESVRIFQLVEVGVERLLVSNGCVLSEAAERRNGFSSYLGEWSNVGAPPQDWETES